MATKTTQDWFAKARSDLALVDFLFESSSSQFLSQMAFHSQQCVEKSIKGYLNHNLKKFRRTHDIAELLLIVKTFNFELANELKSCVALTDYAVAYRYPDAEVEVLSAEKVHEARLLAKTAFSRLLQLL